MATATTRAPKKSSQKRKSGPRVPKRLDTPELRKSVGDLIRLELSQYQLLLNKRAIDELETGFGKWIASQQKRIDQQLRHVPRSKREQWLKERLLFDRRKPENQPPRLLTDYLFQLAHKQIQSLRNLKINNKEFRKTVSKVRNDNERIQVILHYAASLGASPRTLKGDKKAFSRWFDEEAVTDRYLKRVGETEFFVSFVFDRIGLVVAHILQLSTRQHHRENPTENAESTFLLHQRILKLWKRLNLEARLHEALIYEGDQRVYVSALRCLSTILQYVPDGLMDQLFEMRTLMFVHRAAMEYNSDVSIQCEALNILSAISVEHAIPVLTMRLDQPLDGDDMFVRRHALKLVERHLLKSKNRDIDIANRLNDPSPFVRQKIAKVAFLSSHPESNSQWLRLAAQDEDAKVRAAAIHCPAEVRCRPMQLYDALKLLVAALSNERDHFVLRVALHTAVSLVRQFQEASTEDATTDSCKSMRKLIQTELVPQIHLVRTQFHDVRVRRWAAQCVENIWSILDSQARELIQRLRPVVKKIRPGRSKRLKKSWFKNVGDAKLGRVLAVLSQDDFGLDFKRGRLGVRVWRGPSFGFRFWRWFYEFTHLATDKRQGYSHTTGRISTATNRAPSQILGELSETKVPGEPLTIASDGTWRPFIPLLDDFVSILNMSWFWPRKVTFHSSQGRTVVRGPKSLWQRIQAAKKLNLHFKELADLRNWDEGSLEASSYIRAIRELGFEVEFHEHQDADEKSSRDSSVLKFFAGLAAIPSGFSLLGQSLFESPLWKQILRFVDYFGSAFENTLEELLVFASVVLLFVIGRHFYSNYSFRRARRNISISIGGWGTRGKSGTERLKAALIGVLGHGLVSKTTGCEAMFIQSHAFGEPMEIPLFRPYDKATIWEHRNLIVLASQMDPSVFLWECMALNPDFVDVLQRQWTRDDIATITNTYPDHEDIQGPAGHNVATTISGFVPLKSHLVTSEQSMLPYVEESCRKAKTELTRVGWLESGMITDDILERFPYREHPENIALVSALAAKLGVDHEFSLKAMADYLVPDLGVLKTHPPSTVRGRQIEFTNGMSANERFGCMGNWKRLGFDQQDPWDDPCTWISGVVNNRADRVPRSKVFAKIIVDDIDADRFYLIGSNLKGLQGFIDEAWQEHETQWSLLDRGGAWDHRNALTILKKAAKKFRQPVEESQIVTKLERMIQGLSSANDVSPGVTAKEIARRWKEPQSIKDTLVDLRLDEMEIAGMISKLNQIVVAYDEFLEMKKSIETATGASFDEVDQSFRRMIRTWFFRKIVVVENYHATGEEVINTIVEDTPPGFTNRLMGLQNIKGTGLDFVYRFQAWDMCNDACQMALSKHPVEAERGLQALLGMPEIGQLCRNKIRETLVEGRRNPALQRTDLQNSLDQLENRVEGKISKEGPEGKHSRSLSADWRSWLLKTAEEFLDVNDSIRRRESADAIYNDLANQRISRQRAVIELRKLNKRQKGGWLFGKQKTNRP